MDEHTALKAALHHSVVHKSMDEHTALKAVLHPKKATAEPESDHDSVSDDDKAHVAEIEAKEKLLEARKNSLSK